MKISGRVYKPGSAASESALLTVIDGSVSIIVAGETVCCEALRSVVVSDRLANVERKVTFTDGTLFATADNDHIDQLVGGRHLFNRLLHGLESNSKSVIVALLVTVLSFIGFVKWGIPWTSSKIAHALPFSVNQLITKNSLKLLDEYVFEETTLEKEQIDQIRSHFKTLIQPVAEQNQEVVFKLHFRNWQMDEHGIPNAFALPSGDIVLTDTFVTLCASQDEMDSVLLHEVGHVLHRHTLERIIEATFVTTVVMLITGDSNTIADMGLGLGSLLLSSNYSRTHESDADRFAFEQMLVKGLDPKVFSEILLRMTRYMEERKEEPTDQEDRQQATQGGWRDYLSSHPNNEARTEQALHYSKCYEQGMTTCPPML